MPSPLIWPPKMSETLKSTLAARRAAPSRLWMWRTAQPSTRAASNMLVAFQMVRPLLLPSCGASSRSTCVCRISRTDWAMLRLPAESSTMKRSSVFS